MWTSDCSLAEKGAPWGVYSAFNLKSTVAWRAVLGCRRDDSRNCKPTLNGRYYELAGLMGLTAKAAICAPAIVRLFSRTLLSASTARCSRLSMDWQDSTLSPNSTLQVDGTRRYRPKSGSIGLEIKRGSKRTLQIFIISTTAHFNRHLYACPETPQCCIYPWTQTYR